MTRIGTGVISGGGVTAAGGTTLLSGLTIDTDKDWLGYDICNMGSLGVVGSISAGSMTISGSISVGSIVAGVGGSFAIYYPMSVLDGSLDGSLSVTYYSKSILDGSLIGSLSTTYYPKTVLDGSLNGSLSTTYYPKTVLDGSLDGSLSATYYSKSILDGSLIGSMSTTYYPKTVIDGSLTTTNQGLVGSIIATYAPITTVGGAAGNLSGLTIDANKDWLGYKISNIGSLGVTGSLIAGSITVSGSLSVGGSLTAGSITTTGTANLGATTVTSVNVGAGSESLPPYTFTGDLNTGMRVSSADIIILVSGGSDIVAAYNNAGLNYVFYPTDNNKTDLGQSSFKWRDAYVFGSLVVGSVNCSGSLVVGSVVASGPVTTRYMSADYGGAFVSFTPPTNVTNGTMMVAWDTNGAGAGRLYVYANSAWKYIALT